MPLSSTAIMTVEEVVSALGVSEDSRLVPFMRIWTDGVTDETSATVTRLADDTLSLVIVGGANAGTQSVDLTLAANDTSSELATVITALTGWNAVSLGPADTASTDLFHTSYALTPGIAGATVIDAVNNREIERLIDRATLAIERFVGYRIVSRTFREFYDWRPDRVSIYLRNKPVSAVTRFAYRDRVVGSITNSTAASDIDFASIRVRNVEGSNELTYRIVGGSGATSETAIDLTGAANDTLTELDGVIDALGNGWAMTINNSDDGVIPSTDLMDIPAQIASGGATVFLTVPDWVVGEFMITESTGELRFGGGFDYLSPKWYPHGESIDQYGFAPISAHRFNRGRSGRRDGLLVEYTAGYARASVPEDFRNTAIDLIRLYMSNARTRGFSSERLGNYQYSLGQGKTASSVEVELMTNRLGGRQKLGFSQPV